MSFPDHIRRVELCTERLARAAYDGYRAHTNGRSAVSGQLIPAWDVLPAHVIDAWRAAASAVSRETLTIVAAEIELEMRRQGEQLTLLDPPKDARRHL